MLFDCMRGRALYNWCKIMKVSFFMGLPFFKKSRPKMKTPSEKLVALLHYHGVERVLDVGANKGQYARDLLEHGFDGEIISFEPLSALRAGLSESAARYKSWTLAPAMAMGAGSGEIEINVSGKSDMSSVRDINPETLAALPGSEYTHKETVTINALDDIAQAYVPDGKAVFLKVDTQGHEMDVLRGAEQTLPRLTGIQLEVSLLPLYEGEPLFHEISAWLFARGFDSHLVIPGYFSKKLMRQLQIDIVFFKRGA